MMSGIEVKLPQDSMDCASEKNERALKDKANIICIWKMKNKSDFSISFETTLP